MHKYDYSFLKNRIPGNIVGLAEIIADLRSKQDIMAKVPDISVKTVELVLNKMMKEKKITKIGSFKDARYMRT